MRSELTETRCWLETSGEYRCQNRRWCESSSTQSSRTRPGRSQPPTRRRPCCWWGERRASAGRTLSPACCQCPPPPRPDVQGQQQGAPREESGSAVCGLLWKSSGESCRTLQGPGGFRGWRWGCAAALRRAWSWRWAPTLRRGWTCKEKKKLSFDCLPRFLLTLAKPVY